MCLHVHKTIAWGCITKPIEQIANMILVTSAYYILYSAFRLQRVWPQAVWLSCCGLALVRVSLARSAAAAKPGSGNTKPVTTYFMITRSTEEKTLVFFTAIRPHLQSLLLLRSQFLSMFHVPVWAVDIPLWLETVEFLWSVSESFSGLT